MGLPGARGFHRDLVRFTGVFALTSLALIAGYLTALLELTANEWRGFGFWVAGAFPLLFAGTALLNQRLLADVLAALRAEEQGGASHEQLRAAFARIANLPGLLFASGLFWWTVGGVLVGGGVALTFSGVGAFEAGIMVLAAGTGGFVSSVFMFFALKRRFAPLRRALAARVPDAAERAAQVAPIAVGRKLVVSVTGVTFLAVCFALLIAREDSSRPLEARALAQQVRLLETRAATLAPGDVEALAELGAVARELGIASRLALLDAATGEPLGGDPPALDTGELERVRAQPAGGDSHGSRSRHVFAWRPVDGGRALLVAIEPRSMLIGDRTATTLRFGLALAAAAALALALARVLARDLGAATIDLQARAERIAAGDLRRIDPLESEDELGALGRAFEAMASALGGTVRRVAEAADAVEASSGATASSAETASRIAREQAAGVAEAARSMDSVTSQATGIEGAAHELGQLVDESNAAVLELAAAGEQLAETSSVLFGRVDEVSASIERSRDGMREIGGNTASLAATADETASSIEQISVSMQHVTAAASESAELSQRVVETAERGRTTVRHTVDSMRAIRAGIDDAEQVIGRLGESANEIGSIVGVIDGIADETALLALNAAILAAQAGEEGRGFGVVAAQVKQLAGRVLASTREIGERVDALQRGSVEAVEAIAAGSRSVDEGVGLSDESGRALDEITRVARESGERIARGFDAIDEQRRAAAHVAERMESVKTHVGAIRDAAAEQERGNEAIVVSTAAMREVAQQVRATAGEHAAGCARIRETVEGVRESSGSILEAVRLQSASCAEIAGFIERLAERGEASEEIGHRIEQVTRELVDQAARLRDDVARFALSDEARADASPVATDPA